VQLVLVSVSRVCVCRLVRRTPPPPTALWGTVDRRANDNRPCGLFVLCRFAEDRCARGAVSVLSGSIRDTQRDVQDPGSVLGSNLPKRSKWAVFAVGVVTSARAAGLEKMKSPIQHSVTVGVISFKDSPHLSACLNSLREQDDIVADVRVLANACSEKHLKMLRREYPETTIIDVATPAGHSANMNRALSEATTPFVLLLNDDLVLKPGSIRTLVEIAEKEEGVVAVEPRIVSPSGRSEPNGFLGATLGSFIGIQLGVAGVLSRLRSETGESPRPDSAEASTVRKRATGACLLVRQESWIGVGGLDEEMPLGPNDLDLSIRLRQMGGTILRAEGVEVTHLGSETMRRESSRAMELQAVSLERFYRKHHPRQAWAWRLISLAGTAARVCLWWTLEQVSRGREDKEHAGARRRNYWALLKYTWLVTGRG